MKQRDLGLPLIRALGRLGGTATKQQVLQVMESLLGSQLDGEDRALLKTRPEARWHNRAAFERDRLVKEGLLLNTARDRWQLSADGVVFYKDFEIGAAIAELPEAPRDAVLSPIYDFKPKDSSEYVTRTELRVQIKTRFHEDLVERFAKWAARADFDVSNPHPQDLLLGKAGRVWLVEAKVLYNGDAASAARAALAQLLDYRFFIHGNDPAVHLVGLFNEELGAGYCAYLAANGVQPVWASGDSWATVGEHKPSVLRC